MLRLEPAQRAEKLPRSAGSARLRVFFASSALSAQRTMAVLVDGLAELEEVAGAVADGELAHAVVEGFERVFHADTPEGRMICDEVVAADEMDAAIDRNAMQLIRAGMTSTEDTTKTAVLRARILPLLTPPGLTRGRRRPSSTPQTVVIEAHHRQLTDQCQR